MMESSILAPALALGVYVTAVVLPLLALLWLAHDSVARLPCIGARLAGSLGGTLAGMWAGLAVALMAGAIAPHALLWLLAVAVPLLAFAGAAAGIRATTALSARRAIPTRLASPETRGADDRHEAA